MKSYTYKFVDGTTSTVEVEDSLYDLLTEMDEQEKYGNRRETRRHVSVEQLVELCVEPFYEDEYAPDDILEYINDPDLYYAVSMLTIPQRKLLTRLYLKGQTVTDIAEQDGVKVCSISKRFERIYKKIEKFLPDRQLLPDFVAISVGVINQTPTNTKKE